MWEFFEKKTAQAKRLLYVIIALAVFCVGFMVALGILNATEVFDLTPFVPVWGIALFALCVIGIVYLVAYLPVVCNHKKLEELGKLHIADDIRLARPTLPRSAIYCGRKAFFAKPIGIVIPYADVIWAYLNVRYYNGIETGKELVLYTRWKKTYRFQTDLEEANWLLNQCIAPFCPDLIVGYGSEQSKRAKMIAQMPAPVSCDAEIDFFVPSYTGYDETKAKRDKRKSVGGIAVFGVLAALPLLLLAVSVYLFITAPTQDVQSEGTPHMEDLTFEEASEVEEYVYFEDLTIIDRVASDTSGGSSDYYLACYSDLIGNAIYVGIEVRPGSEFYEDCCSYIEDETAMVGSLHTAAYFMKGSSDRFGFWAYVELCNSIQDGYDIYEPLLHSGELLDGYFIYTENEPVIPEPRDQRGEAIVLFVAGLLLMSLFVLCIALHAKKIKDIDRYVRGY